MDLLQIRLDCDQTKLYQNLKDKSGRIQCPACKDHTIDVEQCLSMLYNKELILRNKIELDLDKNLKDELMIKLDDQFDKVVNQIDLQCESLIKRIKDYTLDLINQLQMEKYGLSMEIERMDTQEMSKESFVEEISKETTLSNKLKIEKQFEKKIDDKKRKILEKIKECDYCLKLPDINIQELMGSSELNKKFNMTKSEIGNVAKAKDGGEKKLVDHVNDALDRKGSISISLKSKLNGKSVTADHFCYSSCHKVAILDAYKTQVGPNELFSLIKNEDNTVSLQLKMSTKFNIVSPKNGILFVKYQDTIRYFFNNWEKFYLKNNEDDSYSFRSILYPCIYISTNQNGCLVMLGDEINDDNKFYIEVRNCQEEIKINEVQEIKINEVD